MRICKSLADSSLSFLYSVKLDAAVLSLDRASMEELEAQTAALEVADSVLDVRHAFFEVRRVESAVGCLFQGRGVPALCCRACCCEGPPWWKVSLDRTSKTNIEHTQDEGKQRSYPVLSNVSPQAHEELLSYLCNC